MKSNGNTILNLIYLIGCILIILLNLSPTTCYDGLQNHGNENIQNTEYMNALSEAILNEQNKLINGNDKRRKLIETESNQQNYLTNKELELMKLALKLKNLQENNNGQNSAYESNIPNSDVTIIEENKSDPDELNEYGDNIELESSQIYGIQNVKRSGTSKFLPHVTYQSLCPSKQKQIYLDSNEYVYRPGFYHEVTCTYNKYLQDENQNKGLARDKVCSDVGLSCIQLNRTIYLTKRKRGHDCWETESIIVPAGCECMWPKHSYGDITIFNN